MGYTGRLSHERCGHCRGPSGYLALLCDLFQAECLWPRHRFPCPPAEKVHGLEAKLARVEGVISQLKCYSCTSDVWDETILNLESALRDEGGG